MFVSTTGRKMLILKHLAEFVCFYSVTNILLEHHSVNVKKDSEDFISLNSVPFM